MHLIELDLGTVMGTLQRVFGYQTFIATGFIQRVRKAPDKSQIQTLAVDPDGTLWYNQPFFTKHVNTEPKLIEVLFHELLHHVLGDFTRSSSLVHNIAADIVINATIGRTLGHCDFFQTFYDGTVPPIEGLLRPDSKVTPEGQKFDPIYNTLWGYWKHLKASMDPDIVVDDDDTEMAPAFHSIQELLEALEILLDRKRINICLIGSHGHTQNDTGTKGGKNAPGEMQPTDAGSDEGLSSEIRGKLSEEMAEVLGDMMEGGQLAGFGDHVTEMVIQTLRCNSTLVERMLEDFTTSEALNSIRSYYHVHKRRRSVFPRGNMSRRDVAMLSCGLVPVFYRIDRNVWDQKKRGIAVYIDVSGSVHASLPKICGLCDAMVGMIDTIYQFSNDVQKVTAREMRDGVIKSTGGTDYNCIIDHAIEHKHRKIVVITDGYADCDDERKAKCLNYIEKACVVYCDAEHIGGGMQAYTTDEFWNENYHRTMMLSELFKG